MCCRMPLPVRVRAVCPPSVQEGFQVAEQTIRVALTRMVATGDVTADSVYQFNSRLVQRQAQQEEGCSPWLKAWDGRWEMAVVTAVSRSLPDRVALRKAMAVLRLAEFREGVWIRPYNLVRESGGLSWPGAPRSCDMSSRSSPASRTGSSSSPRRSGTC